MIRNKIRNEIGDRLYNINTNLNTKIKDVISYNIFDTAWNHITDFNCVYDNGWESVINNLNIEVNG